MKLSSIFIIGLIVSQNVLAQEFIEKKAVYAVIKPGSITTLIAINNGLVGKIPFQVGSSVGKGTPVIEVIERETNRFYKTGIKGSVAKLHVTPGAAVTPGMPLITIINPEEKNIEVSLSPQDAQKVSEGTVVYKKNSTEIFGKIIKVSPLVDPDTGAVLSFIETNTKISNLIGDIIPVDLHMRTIKNCKIINISDLDQYTNQFDVEATSKNQACLKPKAKNEEKVLIEKK